MTSVDISLSNQSLLYIPVSLYTTVKASVPVFTYLFSVLLGLEHFRCDIFSCVLALFISLGAAVFTSTHLSIFGISLVIGAAFCGALVSTNLTVFSIDML